MISAWMLSVLALLQPNAPALGGEWHNVDYRAVEVLPNACVRVWLEERKYAFQSQPGGAVQGAYQNVVRAIPVGAPSFSQACRFPAPTQNPIAFQLRAWLVAGSPMDGGFWRLRAQPAPGAGDFSSLKTEEFSTELRLDGTLLQDGTGSLADEDRVLLFRRPSASPPAARQALETTMARLNGGGCLEVMSAMATDKSGVAAVCEMRRQLLTMQGRYVSLTINADTQIDRVPKAVTTPGAAGFIRRRGVFYEFTAAFEKVRVPGNALAVEEGGTWRVVILW